MEFARQVHAGEIASKAAISAALGAGAAYVLGLTAPVEIFGMQMSGMTGIAAATAAGSVAGDVAAHWILPRVPAVQRFSNLGSNAIASITAGAFAAYLLGPNVQEGLLGVAVMAGGSEAIARYSYNSMYPEDYNVYPAS
jgi:hypothetical protein